MIIKLKRILIFLKRKIFNEHILIDENSIKKPIASKSYYIKLFKEASNFVDTNVIELEKKLGHQIPKKWIDDLALHTQICVKKSKINYNHGRILYSVLKNYLHNYKEKKQDNNILILETGTARGFSAICMAKAINDTPEVVGKIITIDLLPTDIPMYWNIIDDHEKKKTRNELLSQWPKELSKIKFIKGKTNTVLKKIKIERINFAFLDAEHEYNSVIDEYLFLKNKQKKDDIIFFDDVTPKKFPGVVQAINQIKKEGYYSVEFLNFTEERAYALAKKL